MNYDLRAQYLVLNNKEVTVVEVEDLSPRGNFEGNIPNNYENLKGMVGEVSGNFIHFKKENQNQAYQKKWDDLKNYGMVYNSDTDAASARNLVDSINDNEFKLDLKYLRGTTLHISVRLTGDVSGEPTKEQRTALAKELISSGMHQTPPLGGGGKRRRKSKKRRKSKRKSKRRKSTKRKSKRR